MNADFISINKYSTVPLYNQIRVSIQEAIRSGKMVPGDKLPTEEEVCRHLNVSRQVVRQAYSELIQEGLIVRERGRGTFVRELDHRGIFMQRINTFKEEMQMLGKTPRTEVLKSEIIPATAYLSHKMKIPEGSRCLILERMRYADEKPYEYCENHIPLERFPGLEKYDFGECSLYETLKEHYNAIPARARRSIRAERVKPKLAEYLGISKSSAVLVIESKVYDQYDQLLELSIESIAGDSHRYDFEVYNH